MVSDLAIHRLGPSLPSTGRPAPTGRPPLGNLYLFGGRCYRVPVDPGRQAPSPGPCAIPSIAPPAWIKFRRCMLCEQPFDFDLSAPGAGALPANKRLWIRSLATRSRRESQLSLPRSAMMRPSCFWSAASWPSRRIKRTIFANSWKRDGFSAQARRAHAILGMRRRRASML